MVNIKGKYMVITWVIYVSIWLVYGQYNGQYMVSTWLVYGQYMVSIWLMMGIYGGFPKWGVP